MARKRQKIVTTSCTNNLSAALLCFGWLDLLLRIFWIFAQFRFFAIRSSCSESHISNIQIIFWDYPSLWIMYDMIRKSGGKLKSFLQCLEEFFKDFHWSSFIQILRLRFRLDEEIFCVIFLWFKTDAWECCVFGIHIFLSTKYLNELLFILKTVHEYLQNSVRRNIKKSFMKALQRSNKKNF